MAVRHVTLRYDTLRQFLEAYDSSLSKREIALSAETLGGEASDTMKLDLVLPIAGRVGPIEIQVVHRPGDGSVAVQFLEMAPEVQSGFDAIFEHLEEVKALLIDRGEVVDADSVPAAPPVAATPVASPPVAAPATTSSAPASAPAQQTSTPGKFGDGFVLPDLTGAEPSEEGALGGPELRNALIEIAIARTTGLLVVVQDDGIKRFGFWQDGGPVGWRTEPVQEAEVLGVLLYRAERLTKEQLARSLEIMSEKGVRQGEALIEMRVVNFPQLVLVLQKQVELILQSVLTQQEGVWAFYPLDTLPERFVAPPLRVPARVYRALLAHTQNMPLEELANSHRENLDNYVRVRPVAREVVGELGFNDEERRFLEILESNDWRTRELFSVSNLGRSGTASVLWALNQLRVLTYGSEEGEERRLGRTTGRIRRKLAAVDTGNSFDVLELHWICMTDEVEKAYRDMKREFAQLRVELGEEYAAQIDTIGVALDAAHDRLRHDASRREYRETIIEQSMLFQTAEILAEKGEMAIMKRDRREATACFAKALELQPGHPKFLEGAQRAATVS